jgi:hypothetical protein
LGLGGLPFTGGMLAKLAMKAQFGEGIVDTLTTLSAIGSTLLMLHFLRRLMQTTRRDPATAVPTGLVRPWLIMAFAAVAVPWILYPTAGRGTLLEALAPETLWATLWPVLLGGMLAVGLWLWAPRLPRVPEGDVVVVGEAALRATVPWGEAVERADGYLQEWPVASLSLLTLVIILGVAMLAWATP